MPVFFDNFCRLLGIGEAPQSPSPPPPRSAVSESLVHTSHQVVWVVQKDPEGKDSAFESFVFWVFPTTQCESGLISVIESAKMCFLPNLFFLSIICTRTQTRFTQAIVIRSVLINGNCSSKYQILWQVFLGRSLFLPSKQVCGKL